MIKIKNKEEIKILEDGGKKLSAILNKVAKKVKPGISTKDLEDYAVNLIDDCGGRPSFKGYKTSKNSSPFPTALCTSINGEVVHAPAIPARGLQNGDIIGIDIGMKYPAKGKGMYTDMAITLPVGDISKKASNLLQVTRESLNIAINSIRPGLTIRELGSEIQKYVEKNGFSVVRELVGHGVGHEVHEDPQIPNYDAGGAYDIPLCEGMVIAVEPMVNEGGWRIGLGSDEMTIVTADGKLSAHFEHTIAVTKKGAKVLTE